MTVSEVVFKPELSLLTFLDASDRKHTSTPEPLVRYFHTLAQTHF